MSVQHANRGIVKKDLQLYYNREWVKSFRGEATTNLVLQTENLTNSWAGNLFNNWINATVTANADLAPNGSLTASRLTGGYSRWTNSITVSASTTYTASIWLKNISLGIDPSINIATGLNGTLVSYGVANTVITRSTIANWRRVSITYTIPASGVNQIQFGIRYEGDYPNQNSILVWGAQFEQKAYASTYLANSSASSISRTNTIAGGGGLLDISGNNVNVDLSLSSFDSTGYIFNGSSNYIPVTKTLYVPMTISGYAKYTDQAKSFNSFINGQPHNTIAISLNRDGAGNLVVYLGNGSAWIGTPSITSSSTITVNVWYNITFTCDGTISTLYLNGVVVGTSSHIPSGFGSSFFIGHLTDGVSSSEYFKGSISSFQVYGRSLTAVEVLQNFNATRTTYGI